LEATVLESWLLFLYKVPHEPSSGRVYVWRKLRRLGAVMLHDAAWVLPLLPDNLEKLRKLSGDIAKLGGDSLLWEARLSAGEREKVVVKTLLTRLASADLPREAE
jgi:hypothetical protein